MNHKTIKYLILFLFTLGCSVQSSEKAITMSEDEIPAEPVANAKENLPEVEDTETPAITVQPTEDMRLKPEDWREWPVIPEVTNTAREIYLEGIAMGNNPRAFSKVGDCQNVREAFLGFFDHPGRYEDVEGIDELRDTIEHFKGHFDRDGQATQFGFVAASVLTPLLANTEICLPEENPLECELRITKPIFVLISLEFMYNGRTPEEYERYMRRIIEYTMEQGAVPILATKADNMEKDHSINLTTAKLAYEYDLPLWNWWAAAQPLWNHGIDSYRDGFHISVEAWNERSKTFLQTLDYLWKGLRETA